MTLIYTGTEQQIADLLATMPTLAKGLGREDRACSFGAVHLALTGTLKDTPLGCASAVIWRWGIVVQDRAPADVCRDHPAWRALLPLVSGTGRQHEEQRGQIVLDWMWDALALVQPLAEARGYGEAWARMCRERTRESAQAAAAAAFAAFAAADAAGDAYAYADAYAASAADAAGDASAAVYASAAYASAYAHAYAAAYAHAYAAADAAYAADADAYDAAWRTINPCALLQKLIAVTDERALLVDCTMETPTRGSDE